jgi:hypothetical protein
MKLHKAIIDIAKQLVYLDSLIYGKVVLHLPVIVHIKASVHHIVAKSIKEIPGVREFLDVFQMICRECLLRETLNSRLSYSLVLLLSPRVLTKCHEKSCQN